MKVNETEETPVDETPDENTPDSSLNKIDDAFGKLGEKLEKSIVTMKQELTKEFADRISDGINTNIVVHAPESTKDERGGFKSFGEFVTEMFKFFGNASDDSRIKALFNESVTEDGGVLVPTSFATSLLNQAMGMSELWSKTKNIPVSTNSVTIPAISDYDHSSGTYYGGIKGYWVGEGQAGTATQGKFDTLTLKIKDFMVLCNLTGDLIQDSVVSIEPLIRSMMSSALGLALDDVYINGTGVGQPIGLINAACKITASKETDQTAATITTENIIDMYKRLSKSAKADARWMINPDCLPQIMKLSIVNGTSSTPLYIQGNNLANAPQGSILGKPVVWTDYCQALGTEGDIILSSPNHYLRASKSAKMAASDHVYFTYNKRVLRLIFRCDGQPWQVKAFTPRYSTVTRSPIITLETRS